MNRKSYICFWICVTKYELAIFWFMLLFIFFSLFFEISRVRISSYFHSFVASFFDDCFMHFGIKKNIKKIIIFSYHFWRWILTSFWPPKTSLLAPVLSFKRRWKTKRKKEEQKAAFWVKTWLSCERKAKFWIRNPFCHPKSF